MALHRTSIIYPLQVYRSCNTLCRKYDNCSLIKCTQVYKTLQRTLFWERDRKGGYDSKEKISALQHIKEGVKEVKTEFKLLTEEVKDFIKADPLIIARPGMMLHETILFSNSDLLIQTSYRYIHIDQETGQHQ